MIRALVYSDYAAYSALRSMGLKTDPTSFWASELEELPIREARFHKTLDHPQQFMAGVFSEGELIGIIGFLREDKKKLNHKGNLWGVYIHPHHRGQGLSRPLMDFATQKAFQLEGLTQINLSVGSDNKTALNLYKSLGFEIYGDEKNASNVNGEFHDELYLVKTKG